MNPSPTRYHGLITPEETLLVIIDLQDRLVPAVADKENVVANAARLAAFAALIGLPVIVSEQKNLGTTVDPVRSAIPGFSPIEKLHFNCFGSDSFRAAIAAAGRRTIILSGLEAHICVAQTALCAPRGFRVHVIADAISSRSPQNRDVAITRMAQAGVTVSTTEMVIYELLQKAGTDLFKAALSLVK